jgi:hypothetical protein
VIEHLSRNEWLDDCIADMLGRGYAESGKTRSNTLLVRARQEIRGRRCRRRCRIPANRRDQQSCRAARRMNCRCEDRKDRVRPIQPMPKF